VVLVWLLISTVLGRANAIIKELKASNLKTFKYGFRLAKNDLEF